MTVPTFSPTLARRLSFGGLALTLLPSFAVFAGVITWPAHAVLMMIGTVLWFATAPLWMRDHTPGA